MMKRNSRQIMLPAKRDAFTAIERFITKQDIELTVDEQRILSRWQFAEGLLRKKEIGEVEIIDEIKKTFSVSVFTAKNDITFAQQLSVRSRLFIKKFWHNLHLERLDKDIETLRKKIIKAEGSIDAKEVGALAKMMEVYTYTLNSSPDEVQKTIMPPPIFQFSLAPNQIIERPMELSEAMKEADEIIMKENSQGVFVEDDSKE